MTTAPETRRCTLCHPARGRGPLAIVAATLAAAVLTAGCGSGDGSDATPTTTTAAPGEASGESVTSTTATDAGTEEESGGACDIVSDEVVAEVLGVSVVRREPHGEPGGQIVSCIKGTDRADAPEDAFFVSVSVIADGAALVDQASGEQGSEPVAGLGDRAVFLPGDGALFIADGADVVQVQVHKGGERGSQQDCVTVANNVLERL